MTDVTNKIADKIKKLLKLSINNTNPNEAAAALAKAKQLMEEYGITISTVEATETKMSDSTIKSKAGATKVPAFEADLMNVIATIFGVKVLWIPKYPYGGWSFFGISYKIAYAEYTAAFLLKALNKARADFVKSLDKDMPTKMKTVHANGFCTGWTREIKSKVKDIAIDPEEARIVDEAYNAYNSERGIRIKTASPKTIKYSSRAIDQGREAAKKVSLHRPMEAGCPNGQLQ